MWEEGQQMERHSKDRIFIVTHDTLLSRCVRLTPLLQILLSKEIQGESDSIQWR